MQGLSSILSLFRNEFNKFNNRKARRLDSMYHMSLRLLRNLTSAIKKRFNCVNMFATLLGAFRWRRFAGGPMTAHLLRYLDPLSPHDIKYKQMNKKIKLFSKLDPSEKKPFGQCM